MNFTMVVKLRMIELNMNRKTLAEKLNMRYTSLADLLSGRCKWSEDKMSKACESLGLVIKFEVKAS